MKGYRWTRNGQLIHQNETIVGVVSLGANRRDWWAYGCMSDFEDTEIGCFASESKARKAVESWVEAQS